MSEDGLFRVYSRGGERVGEAHKSLKEAKVAAKQATIESIRADGYTNRRAAQAYSAESAANTDKALGKTMRNLATAIENGTAKFLDRVRQKVQVEMLRGFLNRAKDNEIRAKYCRRHAWPGRAGQQPRPSGG